MHVSVPRLSRNGRLIIVALIFSTLIAILLVSCAPLNAERLPSANSPDSTPPVTSEAPSELPETVHPEVEAVNREFLEVEEGIIFLLLIVTLVGIGAKRLRVPYTMGLVLIGLALAFFRPIQEDISPSFILAVLVPPLIFEAAFHLNIEELRRNLSPILILAVPGVLVTTFLVGGIVWYGTGLDFPLALVFGALVSATDPVSVIALFRSIGIPNRLQVLLEGESLLNDGTAIVVYKLVTAIAVTSLAGESTGNFGITDSLSRFFYVAGGGLLTGLVLGTIISQIIRRVDDHLIETTLTSILAFGAYVVAELTGFSGVLSVVAAGLISGNIGPRGMSPTTRIVVHNFWEYVAFLANSFVFLLIGLRINLNIFIHNWSAILWAIGGILLARAIGVYGTARISRGIRPKWAHVVYWGGLRGAISLALALSIPQGFGMAGEQIRDMAFGVVLFTLLVQGSTMGRLVRYLRLVKRDEKKEEYERRHARAVAGRSAYEYLERMNRQGLISEHTWQILAPSLREHNQALVDTVRDVIIAEPEVGVEELETARREYLRAQRSAIASLLEDGVISVETYSQLATEVDAALTEPRTHWPEVILHQSERRKSVNRLASVIVQDQDAENAVNSLLKLGLSVTCLPSTGGFLGRRRSTLLIGLSAGQEELMGRVLNQSCRRRVEYTSLPIEGSPIPLPAPTPTPITVGGATIFTFEVERYEEF